MSDSNEVKLEDEATLATNKEAIGLTHPTIKREDSRSNKPADSLDINDQNILDYDDELDNILNPMNTKEKSKTKNDDIDEEEDESDGEVKSENDSENELDDGEVPSPRRYDKTKNQNTCATSETKQEPKEESEKDEEEEGEINDGEKVKKAFVPRVLCKYYQRGKCTWGRGCKFLHPGVNDTGNYSFLEFQDPNAKVYQQQPAVSASATISAAATERPTGTVATNDTAETESAWERGLRHAKEMKEKALRRKQTEGEQFADKKMNLSLKEFENEKENDERYVNVERMTTADDELEDEDLSQYTKSWRQNNSGNAKSSDQFNQNNERSSRFNANNDSKYYQRNQNKTKRSSVSPDRDAKSNYRQKADEWHDPWDRSRENNNKKAPNKDNSKRDRSNYTSSDSDSNSRSRSASRSSYSSKSSYSNRSSSNSYSSRSDSRSPTRHSTKKNKNKKSPERQRNLDRKAFQSVKQIEMANKNPKTKPLPGRQISDFSLKKAGIDSEKSVKKHGKTRSRSNSSTSSYNSSSLKSNYESEDDDDDSYSDDDNDDNLGASNKKKNKSSKFNSSKKPSVDLTKKRSAHDSKLESDAKKIKPSSDKQAPTTDKKQMIKDQLKLLESALKKKTSAK